MSLTPRSSAHYPATGCATQPGTSALATCSQWSRPLRIPLKPVRRRGIRRVQALEAKRHKRRLLLRRRKVRCRKNNRIFTQRNWQPPNPSQRQTCASQFTCCCDSMARSTVFLWASSIYAQTQVCCNSPAAATQWLSLLFTFMFFVNMHR